MAAVKRIGFTNAQDYKSIQGKVVLAPDILKVDYDQLHALGVKRLVFDYDGTLAHKWRALPDVAVMNLLSTLQKRFTVVIYSNNIIFWRERRKFFSGKNIMYTRTGKPFIFETRDDIPTVIIGDKWLTDRLYAWRQNWGCVLVGKIK